jgi:hypothetical protein
MGKKCVHFVKAGKLQIYGCGRIIENSMSDEIDSNEGEFDPLSSRLLRTNHSNANSIY